MTSARKYSCGVFERLFVLTFDPFADASFYLTFSFTQFYSRIGLTHTLTAIMESSTKTLASID